MKDGDEHDFEFVKIHNDMLAKQEKEEGRFDPSPSKVERLRADQAAEQLS